MSAPLASERKAALSRSARLRGVAWLLRPLNTGRLFQTLAAGFVVTAALMGATGGLYSPQAPLGATSVRRFGGVAAEEVACEVEEGQEAGGLLGFCAVFTGFGSASRRAALRAAWFPPTREGLEALERRHGLALRFAIGEADVEGLGADGAARAEAALQAEAARHGGFLRLAGVTERYTNLPAKTRAFFTAAAAHPLLRRYRWLVKLDDDIMLLPGNLAASLRRNTPAQPATEPWPEQRVYLGCVKEGKIYRAGESKSKWAERSWGLLADDSYHQNCWGPAYAMTQAAAAQLASTPGGGAALRELSNEDTTVGLWALAFSWKIVNDLDWCRKRCRPGAAVVYDIPKCAGLCKPETKLPIHWANAECHQNEGDGEEGLETGGGNRSLLCVRDSEICIRSKHCCSGYCSPTTHMCQPV